jgi:lipopolysaccharide/colanic/teichoic acid biosynthesis glycosyltransferase
MRSRREDTAVGHCVSSSILNGHGRDDHQGSRSESVDTKRLLDITLGSLALALATPMIAWAAMAMRVSGDRGPFLYRARRVGEEARVITVLKIRTMTDGAAGSRVTIAQDPRVTPVGRILRRYKIDELPQLINVVRGEMSLVGPRPEDPSYVDLSNPLHRRVFSAKPGITGPAQLAYHDEADHLVGLDAEQRYRTLILPEKLILDAEYLDHRTTWLDLQILLKTVWTVLS